MSATVGARLRAAAEALATVSASPRLDAEVLLATVLGRSRASLLAVTREPLAPLPCAEFERLVELRADGQPVAYLTGRREFWSMDLAVSPAVLVPRPETELLVEWALERLPSDSAARVADLGTGSGAIALAIARERPRAAIVATDLSLEALCVAEANAARLGVAHVAFRHGHWLEACARLAPFDVVVSNPPYVAAHDPHLALLAAEPRLALTDEADGLTALSAIVRAAPRHLVRAASGGGWLLLEHGHDQGAAVRALLVEAGFKAIETRRDLAGHERASGGRLP